VFLSVTGCEALDVPTVWLAKVRLAGETEAVGTAAVPLKVTVCVAGLALSVMTTVPGSADTAVAEVKVTLMLQLPPALTLLPQVFVSV
jgi:hypothetical protein